MDEILERLQALPVLPDNVPRIYSWRNYRESAAYNAHYDEFARITRSTPVQWRYIPQDLLDIEVDRCTRMGAKLCLNVSPHVPESEAYLYRAMKEFSARWKEFRKMLNDQADIGCVQIDLEGFPYTRHLPRTQEQVRHDRAVHRYNNFVYDVTRQYVPDDIVIKRDGHLGVIRHGRIAAHYKPTQPLDIADMGWNTCLYEPIDVPKTFDQLQITIDHAKVWNIHEGSIWITLGATIVNWECPGLDIYATPDKQIGNSNVYAVPYDPRLSFNYGACFGRPWFSSEDHDELYRGGDYPQFGKVKAISIWPGLFHPHMWKTEGPHLCAFLEGLITQEPFDVRLQEIQRELWLAA
jgi:hypothetical protein